MNPEFVKSLLVELHEAIDTMKTYVDGKPPPSHDACHRLFHCFLYDPAVYNEVYFNVASPYVRQRALTHILRLEKEQQRVVENLLLVNAITMGVAGFVVEKRVHLMLIQGGSLSVRLLPNEHDAEGVVMKTFVVNRSDSASGVPTSFERSTLSDGPYYIPISQNMASIDSFYYQDPSTCASDSANGASQPRVILFQVTVSKNHPIKSEGVVDVLTRLQLWRTALAETVAFVFVVPKKYATAFKKQRMLATPTLSAAMGVREVKGIGPAITRDLNTLSIHTVGELESVARDPRARRQGSSNTSRGRRQ